LFRVTLRRRQRRGPVGEGSEVGWEEKAARRRREHEQRIAAQSDPRHALYQSWAWVMAELKASPSAVDEAVDVVTDLAVALNRRRGGDRPSS
jgi:hypothetical protein